MSLADAVRFLGTRSDVPEVLSLVDVLALTSHIEANPVSILEAMAAEKPVVATRVGSVAETVQDGKTGYLVAPGSGGIGRAAGRAAPRPRGRPPWAAPAGRRGGTLVHRGMVAGYEDLLEGIYAAKAARRGTVPGDCPALRGEARENGTVPFGG